MLLSFMRSELSYSSIYLFDDGRIEGIYCLLFDFINQVIVGTLYSYLYSAHESINWCLSLRAGMLRLAPLRLCVQVIAVSMHHVQEKKSLSFGFYLS